MSNKKKIRKKKLFCVLLHQHFEGIRYVPVEAALSPLLGCGSLHEAVHQPVIGMKLNWKMHLRSCSEVFQLMMGDLPKGLGQTLPRVKLLTLSMCWDVKLSAPTVSCYRLSPAEHRACRCKCSACFSKINNIVLVLLITSDLFPESHIFQLTKVILLHCWINGVTDSEEDLLVFPITMP